jgi:hypothetical protein
VAESVTGPEWLRVTFGLTFVILAAVALGSVITGSTNGRDWQAGAVLFVLLGVGAGLWALVEWRRKP